MTHTTYDLFLREEKKREKELRYDNLKICLLLGSWF